MFSNCDFYFTSTILNTYIQDWTLPTRNGQFYSNNFYILASESEKWFYFLKFHTRNMDCFKHSVVVSNKNWNYPYRISCYCFITNLLFIYVYWILTKYAFYLLKTNISNYC